MGGAEGVCGSRLVLRPASLGRNVSPELGGACPGSLTDRQGPEAGSAILGQPLARTRCVG